MGTSYFAVWFAAIRLETVSFWGREGGGAPTYPLAGKTWP